MTGCRSATKVSSWLTALSTSCGRSRRPRLSRTSGSAPFSPLSASSRLRGPNPAARRHRADAIRAMRDCSKPAEFLYKPSGLTLARGPCSGWRAGAALRTGSAPARQPNPATVTFLNGRNSDISKWWTHKTAAVDLDPAGHLVAVRHFHADPLYDEVGDLVRSA